MSKKELKKSLDHWKKQIKWLDRSIAQEDGPTTMRSLLESKRDEVATIIRVLERQLEPDNEKN